MTLFQLFKASFTNRKQLAEAKNVTFPKTFLYILFLSVLLTIPIVFEIGQVLQRIQTDFQEISEKIPADTTFSDGKLSTAEKDAGFIYQTDYLIFTFDPEGKTTADNVQDDLIENVIGLAFLEDKLVFAVSPDSILAVSVPSSPIEFNYTKLDPKIVSSEMLTGQTTSTGFIALVSVLSVVLALLPIAFNFAMNLLMLTLFANIFNRFRGAALTIGDTFKIMTFSATIGVIVSVLADLVLPSINTSVILTMITIFTYYQVLPPRPRIKK